MTVKERLEHLALVNNEANPGQQFRAECPNDDEGSVLLRGDDGKDRIIFSTAIHTPGKIYHCVMADGRYLLAP